VGPWCVRHPQHAHALTPTACAPPRLPDRAMGWGMQSQQQPTTPAWLTAAPASEHCFAWLQQQRTPPPAAAQVAAPSTPQGAAAAAQVAQEQQQQAQQECMDVDGLAPAATDKPPSAAAAAAGGCVVEATAPKREPVTVTVRPVALALRHTAPLHVRRCVCVQVAGWNQQLLLGWGLRLWLRLPATAHRAQRCCSCRSCCASWRCEAV
jgi:hypothetical protein